MAKNIDPADPLIGQGVEAEEVPLEAGRANVFSRPFAMAPLDLSGDRIPTETELRAAGGLGGALTPIDNDDPDKVVPLLTQQGKKEEDAEKQKKRLKRINRSFGEAIVALKTHNFARTIALYQAHIQEFPDSPWAGEIYLHLGGWAASNGRYTEAEERFQAIANVTSDDPSSPTYDLAQKTKVTWASMDISLGRWSGAIAKLDNILATERNGTRLNWARYMRQQADLSKDSRTLQACGAHALASVLVSFDKKDAAARIENMQAPREAGFSLAELEQLARKNGVPMRGFQAGVADIAKLPMPLLVHYQLGGQGAAPTCPNCPPLGQSVVSPLPTRPSRFRVGGAKMFRVGASETVNGHFLIVRHADARAKIISIYNPLEKREYQLTYAQFAHEWSGTGLALERPLLAKRSATVRLLSLADMGKRKGGCCCRPAGQADLGGSGGNSDSVDGPVCRPKKKNMPQSLGAPSFEMNPANQNLHVYDTPLSYQTPIGMSMDVTMHHNRLEGQRIYSMFGAKWSCLWDVALMRTSPTSIIVAMPDGSQQTYTPTANALIFRSTAPDNFSELRQLADGTYNLYFPEGGFWRFTKPNGLAEFRLTRVEDIFGNWMNVNWQNVTLAGAPSVRVASVTEGAVDDQGSTRGLTFSYASATSINPTQISDPYGRSAYFTYKAISLSTRNNLYTDTTGTQVPETNYTTVVLATAQDMNGWVTRYSYEANYGDILRVEVAPSQGDLTNNTRIRAWTFAPVDLTHTTRTELPALNIADALGQTEQFYYNANHGVGGGSIHIPKDAWAAANGGQPVQTSYAFVDAGGQSRVAQINEPATTLQPYAAVTTNINYAGPFVNRIVRGTGGQYITPDPTYGVPTHVEWDLPGWSSPGSRAFSDATYDTFVDTTRAAIYPDLTQVIDAYNHVVTKIFWNNLHQPTTIYYGPSIIVNGIPTAFQSCVQLSYTRWGAISSRYVSMPSGTVSSTFWNYDATHRLASVTMDAPAGSAGAKQVVAFGYETAVPYRVASVQDERGYVTNYSYDNFDRVTRIGYFDSSQELFTYCSVCGALLSQTGRDGQTTTFIPDSMGRTTQVNYPDGRSVNMTYTPDGLLKTLVDQNGKLTQWTYDEMGRLSSRMRPNAAGLQSQYVWQLGNITREEVPRSDSGIPRFIRYNYSYGSLTGVDGVQAGVNGQDVSYYSYSYDRNGRVNSSLNGGNLTYDVLGRVVAEDQDATDTGSVIDTAYNGAGDVSGLAISDRAGNLRDGYYQSFSYDSLGRSTNNNTPAGNFVTGYDPNTASALPTSITWPGTSGRTDFSFDGFGRQTSAVYRRGDITSAYSQFYAAYDLGTLANGVRTARDVMTIFARQLRDPGEALDGGENINYGYEAVNNRLTSEVGSGNNSTLSNTFAYDTRDNRFTSRQTLQNKRSDYVIDVTNAVAKATDYATDANGTATATLASNLFSYDERGNLKSIAPAANANATSVTYEYDLIDRLTAATTFIQSTDTNKPGPIPTQRVEFTYDQQNRRVVTVEKTGSGVWGQNPSTTYPNPNPFYWHPNWTTSKITRTLYAGMQPIQERDQNNVTQTQLYWGDNGLAARRVKNGAGWRDYYVASDLYGSVAQLIRADTGTVVARYNYDAYGNTTKQNGIAAPADALDQDQVNQPYRYQSHYLDKTTGLYDFGYRFYSPGLGRFLNQDPLGEAGGLNLYGFVGGNPTNSLDPYGLCDTSGYPNQKKHAQDVADADWYLSNVVGEGLLTGLNATGSSLTFGAYSGGKYAREPGFGVSKGLAYGGMAAGALAGGIAAAGTTAGKGALAFGAKVYSKPLAGAAIDGAAGAAGKSVPEWLRGKKSGKETLLDIGIGAGSGMLTKRFKSPLSRAAVGAGTTTIKDWLLGK